MQDSEAYGTEEPQPPPSDQGANKAAPPLEVVALIPWIVLVELDGLKGRLGESVGPAGAAASVSQLARAAQAKLRDALVQGGRFYSGQSLKEFREAESRHKLGGKSSTADDRILHCCLQYKVRARGARGLASGRQSRNALKCPCIFLLSS